VFFDGTGRVRLFAKKTQLFRHCFCSLELFFTAFFFFQEKRKQNIRYRGKEIVPRGSLRDFAVNLPAMMVLLTERDAVSLTTNDSAHQNTFRSAGALRSSSFPSATNIPSLRDYVFNADIGIRRNAALAGWRCPSPVLFCAECLTNPPTYKLRRSDIFVEQFENYFRAPSGAKYSGVVE
jgi:hypothetical protein